MDKIQYQPAKEKSKEYRLVNISTCILKIQSVEGRERGKGREGLCMCKSILYKYTHTYNTKGERKHIPEAGMPKSLKLEE